MSTVNNNFYKDIGKSLEESNKTKGVHNYLYAQNYVLKDSQHPFHPINPLTYKFFGPRNLTLLIISVQYNLPSNGATDVLNNIKIYYKQWTDFKVYIWVDLVLAQLVLDESGSDVYYNKMLAMADQLEIICNDMKDYGFIWKGILYEGKDAAYFQPDIDEFFKEKAT